MMAHPEMQMSRTPARRTERPSEGTVNGYMGAVADRPIISRVSEATGNVGVRSLSAATEEPTRGFPFLFEAKRKLGGDCVDSNALHEFRTTGLL